MIGLSNSSIKFKFFTLILLICIRGVYASPQGMRVAILPFKNLSEMDREWLSMGISDTLIAKFSKSKKLHVIERERIKEVLLSSEKQSSENIRKLLGVEYLLVGSYVILNNTIKIDARILHAKTSKVEGVSVLSIRGRFSDIFALQNELAEKFSKACGLLVEYHYLVSNHGKTLNSYEQFNLGKIEYKKRNYEKAINIFVKAQKMNEGEFFAEAHSWEGQSRIELAKEKKDEIEQKKVIQEHIDKFRKDAADAAPALFDLGIAYQVSGAYRKAYKAFQDFLRWSNKSTKMIRWKKTMPFHYFNGPVDTQAIGGPFDGYTSLIEHNGRVYTLQGIDKSRAKIHCLELDTGKELWTNNSLIESLNVSSKYLYTKNNTAGFDKRVTMTVDDKHLYVVSDNCIVALNNRTGKENYTLKLPDGFDQSHSLGTIHVIPGQFNRILVDRKKVNSKIGCFMFNGETGSILWRASDNFNSFRNAFVIKTSANKMLSIETGEDIKIEVSGELENEKGLSFLSSIKEYPRGFYRHRSQKNETSFYKSNKNLHPRDKLSLGYFHLTNMFCNKYIPGNNDAEKNDFAENNRKYLIWDRQHKMWRMIEADQQLSQRLYSVLNLKGKSEVKRQHSFMFNSVLFGDYVWFLGGIHHEVYGTSGRFLGNRMFNLLKGERGSKVKNFKPQLYFCSNGTVINHRGDFILNSVILPPYKNVHNDASAMVHSVECLMNINEHKLARKHLNQLFAEGLNLPKARWLSALIYEFHGDTKRALQEYYSCLDKSVVENLYAEKSRAKINEILPYHLRSHDLRKRLKIIDQNYVFGVDVFEESQIIQLKYKDQITFINLESGLHIEEKFGSHARGDALYLEKGKFVIPYGAERNAYCVLNLHSGERNIFKVDEGYRLITNISRFPNSEPLIIFRSSSQITAIAESSLKPVWSTRMENTKTNQRYIQAGNILMVLGKMGGSLTANAYSVTDGSLLYKRTLPESVGLNSLKTDQNYIKAHKASGLPMSIFLFQEKNKDSFLMNLKNGDLLNLNEQQDPFSACKQYFKCELNDRNVFNDFISGSVKARIKRDEDKHSLYIENNAFSTLSQRTKMRCTPFLGYNKLPVVTDSYVIYFSNFTTDTSFIVFKKEKFREFLERLP